MKRKFAVKGHIFFWVKNSSLNIKGLRFHDLRHTAATRMVESGANIVAVSRILGHADLKTTMRYAHPEDSLKDAVGRLEKSTKTVAKSVAIKN